MSPNARRAIAGLVGLVSVALMATTALAVSAWRSSSEPVELAPVLAVQAPPVVPVAVAPAVVVPAVPPRRLSAAPVPDADPLQGWAVQIWQRTGIPVPALRAYGRAELRLADEQPRCRVGWVTLAGIGEVESQHGQYQRRTVDDTGRPSRPIVGIALDGDGVARIGDTDGGVLDGDTALDRAVGPMQVLPSTWRRWAADGDGDGLRDPQDLDDASLAAARYLCAAGTVRTDAGWRAAVLSYNASDVYLGEVSAWAGAYARASVAS